MAYLRKGTAFTSTVTAGTLGAGVTKKVRAFSVYNSSAGSVNASTWTNFAGVGTWTERYDTHSDYNTGTGVFQPTKAGNYLCGYSISFGVLDSGERLESAMGKNWTSGDPTSEGYGWARHVLDSQGGGNIDHTQTGSAIIDLSTSDTVVPLCLHTDNAGTISYVTNQSQFWAIYLGER